MIDWPGIAIVVRRGRARAAHVVLVAAIAVAACGGETDEQRLQADEIARAKAEARREARAEQQARDAAAEARKLRKEIEALKRRDAARPARRTRPAPTPILVAPTDERTDCGEGISVNAATTCPFARNVRDAYVQSGGASAIDVYSPVTKRIYSLRCTDGIPTVCAGGNNARVYLR